MPLTRQDRQFINTVDRLKTYLPLLALANLLYLILLPAGEVEVTTLIVGVSLCLMFWLTQRLLSVITRLDLELTRLMNALNRSLTPQERKELFG